MAICVIPEAGDPPCQCFTPGGIQTVSPGPNLLNLAAPVLHPTDAVGDDQGLAKRMGVPGGARTGFETDRAPTNARRSRSLEPPCHRDLAGEVLGRAVGRLLRGGALDRHLLVALSERCPER